jgi:hypothetical protein
VVPAADSDEAVEVSRIFMPPEPDSGFHEDGLPDVPVGSVALSMLETMVPSMPDISASCHALQAHRPGNEGDLQRPAHGAAGDTGTAVAARARARAGVPLAAVLQVRLHAEPHRAPVLDRARAVAAGTRAGRLAVVVVLLAAPGPGRAGQEPVRVSRSFGAGVRVKECLGAAVLAFD